MCPRAPVAATGCTKAADEPRRNPLRPWQTAASGAGYEQAPKWDPFESRYNLLTYEEKYRAGEVPICAAPNPTLAPFFYVSSMWQTQL